MTLLQITAEAKNSSGNRVFTVAAGIIALFGTSFLLLFLNNWDGLNDALMLTECAICYAVAIAIISLRRGLNSQ